ncbi:probable pseudouridine-5'-phosphatase [Planococcus citri]|uniref:probable pseudouridine-5'-phosphatase n=1 Tax=Planococcus citri TaxID=170843 RepID=UPI0031F9ECF3
MLKTSSALHFRPAKYVIMELDGTIIDTRALMNDIVSEYLKKFNKTLSPEMATQIMGRITEDLYDVLKAEYKINHTYQEFKRQMTTLKEKYLQNVQLMAGAESLVSWFYERDIPTALVTSCTGKEFEKKTVSCEDLIKKFHHVTTRDDIDRGKPYPDIFIICASQFIQPPKPQDVLVFEGTVAGAEAARSAGMQVVLVGPCFTEAEKRKATQAIDNLCLFDADEFGLS